MSRILPLVLNKKQAIRKNLTNGLPDLGGALYYSLTKKLGGSMMKKAVLTISIEQERLSAIRFYASKKESTIEAELEDFIGKLYEKFVPVQTREYLDSQLEAESPSPLPKRLKKDSNVTG